MADTVLRTCYGSYRAIRKLDGFVVFSGTHSRRGTGALRLPCTLQLRWSDAAAQGTLILTFVRVIVELRQCRIHGPCLTA